MNEGKGVDVEKRLGRNGVLSAKQEDELSNYMQVGLMEAVCSQKEQCAHCEHFEPCEALIDYQNNTAANFMSMMIFVARMNTLYYTMSLPDSSNLKNCEITLRCSHYGNLPYTFR